MIRGALLYPELGTAMAPILSQYTITLCPCQEQSHTAQARTIRSFILDMLSTPSPGDILRPSHPNCIHLSSGGHIAPHPKDPEASIHKTADGDLGCGIILTPFHSAMKVCHHKPFYIGFKLDSMRNEIRIPEQKMQDIKTDMARWISKKSCRRKELESLIGRLCHASRVVQPGKTFMRCLFEALAGSRRAHHHIRLSSAVRADILKIRCGKSRKVVQVLNQVLLTHKHTILDIFPTVHQSAFPKAAF